MKHQRTKYIVLVTLLLTFAINLAYAAPKSPVLPPTSNAYGKSYAEWSAAWLEWAFSIPTNVNPLLDATGAYAAVGQSGHIWFLTGTLETGTVVRKITIPTGTPLFFPIVNSWWVNVPELGDNPWSPEQEAYVRDINANVVDTATNINLEIDGRSVPSTSLDDYRFESTLGICQLPADNLLDYLFSGYGDTLPGPHECVADGYWVMLPPLSVGLHTIHFTGEFSSGFSLDVTYNITVQPVHKKVKHGHKKVNIPLHP